MKKVLISFIAVIALIFGGLSIFVNTKSDFIIQKISEVLENNLNAKLQMNELPKISIFPSLSVSAGKSSLTAPEFSVTFDKAFVNISLTQLLSGTVHINSVLLDNLALKYTDTKANSTEKNNIQVKEKSNNSKSIEEIFALIPANISITNSQIYYQNKDQIINLTNVNTEIEDFGINKNSSVMLQGQVAFKNKKEDLEFELNTATDFLFMGESLEYHIKNFTFTPLKGLPFTHPVEITAESSINLNPILIEKMDGVIKSPFINLTLTGKGNNKENNLTLDGEIFALNLQENFLPNIAFQNLPKSVKITAKLNSNPKNIILEEAIIKAHDGIININADYDIANFALQGKIFAKNLAIQDYLPKANTESSPQKSTAKGDNISTSANKSKSPRLTFNITADAEKIHYNTYTLDKIHSVITGKINNKETLITVKPLTVTKQDESIHLSAKMELAPKDIISVTVDGQNLDVQKWTKGLMEKSPFNAKISAKSALTFKSSDPLNTLNGNGQINGANLRIETKLLPFITNLLQLNLKLQDYYEFTELKAPYTIKNGQLSTTNTYIDSSSILVSTNGTTHLGKQSLNLNGNAQLKQQGLIFPYKVTGNYTNPKIGLDMSKQLLILGKGIINTGGSVGSGVVEGGKTVGSGVVEGGKAIGGGLIESGKLLEKELGKLFK